MEVYNELGYGFLEKVGLLINFSNNGLEYKKVVN